MIYALAFLASGAVVVFAGTLLAKHADRLADLTGLGRLWIGTILLAAATSLPELATDVAAVRLDAADLAIGDLFGSSMANMLILAIIDLLPPRGQVLRLATFDHALSACLAITMNALVALLVLVQPGWTLLGVSPGSVLIILLYLGGARAVYHQTSGDAAPADAAPAPSEMPADTGLRRTVLGFAGAAMVILVSAPAFAWSAKGLADVTGLGTTLVGTWLVGLSTSLPELVASIAAVRMGAFDLAVGNLFGSNALNMTIVFVLDLVHPGTAIFAGLDRSHAVSGMIAMILMSLGLAAIVYRAERRLAMIEPSSLLMVLTYLFGLWVLYGQATGG